MSDVCRDHPTDMTQELLYTDIITTAGTSVQILSIPAPRSDPLKYFLVITALIVLGNQSFGDTPK